MSGQNVGGVRPTQLIYTYGVGSAVDLPQFSAMVMGLDDWPAADMEEIREDRLLRVVRHVLGGQVRRLKAAPSREDAPGPLSLQTCTMLKEDVPSAPRKIRPVALRGVLHESHDLCTRNPWRVQLGCGR